MFVFQTCFVSSTTKSAANAHMYVTVRMYVCTFNDVEQTETIGTRKMCTRAFHQSLTVTVTIDLLAAVSMHA